MSSTLYVSSQEKVDRTNNGALSTDPLHVPGKNSRPSHIEMK